MAQQFDYPKTETQLREIQDKLYQHSKEAYDAGGRPAFKGLLEIMSAEATIVTAIHNIKSNRGSETPGVDSKTMRRDYLQRSHSWVISNIQSASTAPKKKKGNSNKACPNCGRKIKQQFIGLQHCRCGVSWKKGEGFFERSGEMGLSSKVCN